MARVVAELTAQNLVPSIVVANAGFGVVGQAQALTLADYQRQFDTNTFGVLRTFHETFDALQRAGGRFVIMGSVAGYISAPGGSAYAMSKFAVRALAESLHGDLKGTGVSCTLVSPGFVDSDIRRTDNRGSVHATAPDPVPAWLRMPTDQAARIMVSGILRRSARSDRDLSRQGHDLHGAAPAAVHALAAAAPGEGQHAAGAEELTSLDSTFFDRGLEPVQRLAPGAAIAIRLGACLQPSRC